MKGTLKRTLAIMLAVIISLGSMPLVFAAQTDSNSCGESLTWSLDTATGVLEISGTGAMCDYLVSKTPWYGDRSVIKTVNILDGVTSIGSGAFYDCDYLEIVSVPNSVLSIGDNAFRDCESLEEIILPDNLTSIGKEAFYYSGLIGISIPASVTSIGDNAFGWCGSLEKISVEENNGYFSSDEYGVLFNKDKTELVKYPNNNQETDYAIPDTVKSLKGDSFENCYSLKTVTIPASVTRIGDGVFYNCYIEKIIVDPDNGYYSGDEYGALFDKNKNTLIQYPANSSETSYAIPESVISIESDAFYNNLNLKSVVVSNGITALEDYVFLFCDALEYVHVPASVTEIGEEIIDIAAYICSDTENCFAKEYAEANGYTFELCKNHKVTGIALSETEIEITNKQTYQLEAVVTPETASDKTVTWSSDNTDVATVDESGVITAVSAGTANITAAAADGVNTAVCKVTVIPRMFSVTWVVDGVETVDSVAEGEAIPVPDEPEKDGHTFAGWSPEVFETMPARDLKFTAVWTVNSFKSVFDANGGKWADGSKKKNVYTVYENEIILPEAPEKQGYSFTGWTPQIPETMPDEELTFTAVWTANSYNAVFDANGGKWADNSNSKTVSALFDTQIEAPEAPSKQGYVFAGWSPEVGIMDDVNGKAFAAMWDAATDTLYTVETYLMGTDGEYTMTSEPLEGTTDSVVSAEYTVETGFLLNGEKSVLSGTVAADGSLVLKIYFDRIKSTIVINGETVECMFGQVINEPDKPDAPEGHVQNGWVDENGDIVEFPLILDENFPAEIKPCFVKQSYSVTWDVDGVITEEVYDYQSKINVPANPEKEGYIFTGWTPDVPDFMPAYGLTFVAGFEKIIYICPDCSDKFDDEALFNEHIAYEQAKKSVRISVKNNPGTATIKYGETLRLTAVTTSSVADTKIYWYVDGVQQGEGEKFDISFNSGTKTVTVKIVDGEGNVLKDADGKEISDEQKVSVNSSFWQKIVSFFKNLFRMNRTVTQAIFGV